MAFGIGEAVTRQSNLVYYPTAAPVTLPVVIWTPLGDAQNVVSRKRKIASDNLVVPPQVLAAAAAITSTIACAVCETTIIGSRLVYDPLSAPIPIPAAVTPAQLGFSASDKHHRLPRQKSFQASSYVFGIPVDDMGWVNFDQPRRLKTRIVSDQLTAPPQVVAAATAPPTIACAIDETTIVLSKVVYDQTTGSVFTPASVPTPSAFGYQTVEGLVKRKIRYLPEAFAFAPIPVAYTPTPADFGYQSDDWRVKRGVRYIPEAQAFVRRAVPTVSTGVQQDGDPDYWKLPWFNVQGGSFAETLRTKAITSLEEAADLAEQAKPAKAKRAVRKAARGLQEYVRTAGSLLSDDTTIALGRMAKQLNYAASQWDRSELIERVSDARMALLAYEAAQQDEEDALIALMVN